MADPKGAQSAAQRKAHNHFTAAERRDASFKDEVERERSERGAKNIKLRALRLAKEANDKIAAVKLAAEKAENKAKTSATRSVRKKKAPAT